MTKALVFVCMLLTISLQDSKETIVVTEGFYAYGWEQSSFYEIKEDKCYKAAWLKLKNNYKISDTIQKAFENRRAYIPYYIKIKAIKREGGRYGHIGVAKKEFEVLQVLAIDTTYTMNDFIEKR